MKKGAGNRKNYFFYGFGPSFAASLEKAFFTKQTTSLGKEI